MPRPVHPRPSPAFVAAAIVLLTLGLWNADIARNEKGFYAMAFALALFGSIVVQKYVRDLGEADALAPARAAEH
jgi:hypothetical protein